MSGTDSELVDAREIARRFGIASHRVVLDWRMRPDFPRPVARRRTFLWRWSDVEAWQRTDPIELIVRVGHPD